MPLYNAPVCKRCGERRTNNPTGLCSRCLEKAGPPKKPCLRCGKKLTRSVSGLCKDCARKEGLRLATGENVEKAIEKQKVILKGLQMLLDGKSYAEIAKALGISVADAYIEMQRVLFNGSAVDPTMINQYANEGWLDNNTKFDI